MAFRLLHVYRRAGDICIRGVARIFKGGVEFLLKRAKQGASEVSVAYVRLCVFLEPDSLVGSGVKSRWKKSISLDLKAPDCEEIDILNTFFTLNFSNTMTTFMATFMATFMTTFMATFTALLTLLWRLTF